MELENIHLVFEYKDGVKIEADIDNNYGWSQYGSGTKELGENVSLLEAINEVAQENANWVIED